MGKHLDLRIAKAAVTAALAMGLVLTTATAPAGAQSDRQRLRLLERTVQDLLKRDEARERELRRLRGIVRRLGGGRHLSRGKSRGHSHQHGAEKRSHSHADGKRATNGAKGGSPSSKGSGSYEHLDAVWRAPVGDGAVLILRRIGVDGVIAAGATSESNELAEQLFGGGHDAKVKGFTIQTIDLSISGSLAPWFDAYVNMAFFIDQEGESRFELEEAWIRTWQIAGFLRIKAGQFFSQFGRFNPLHVHDWLFINQPIVMTRFFGEDNLRGQGIEFEAKLPLPWHSRVIVSMQNANGETMYSFLANDEAYEERPVGGRAFNANEVDGFDEFVYLIRWANRFRLSGKDQLTFGVSAIFGPNATGNTARTYIFGFDIGGRHHLGNLGVLLWNAEFLYRSFEADPDPNNGFAGDVLRDYGFYAQVVWFFDPKWGIGARAEYASGSGQSVGEVGRRGADPFRSDRLRLAPIIIWRFAPYAALRAQYTYDFATFLPDDRRAHSFFVSLKFAFGLGGGHVHDDGDDHGHNGHNGGGGHSGHNH